MAKYDPGGSKGVIDARTAAQKAQQSVFDQFAASATPQPSGASLSPAIQRLLQQMIGGGDAPHATSLDGLVLGSQNVPRTTDAVGQWANNLFDLAKQIAGPVAKGDQPIGGPGSDAVDASSMAAFDPAAMAAAQFAPQFEALNRMRAEAQQRASVGQRDVTNMYNTLAGDTNKQGAAIKQQYADTGKGIQDAYAQAANNVTGNTNKTVDNISAELARLGQQQAAGTVFNDQAKALQESLRSLGSEGANQGALNQNLGQNAQTYNTQTADTQRMAGANASSAIGMQLANLLNQYDLKGLDLTGQQKAAENGYIMDAQTAQQKAMADAQDNMYKQAQLDLDARKLELSQQNADRQFGLDSQNFDLNSQKALYGSKNPADILTYNASKLFGDQQSAANAVDAILSTYQNSASGGDVSFNTFMQEFMKDHPNYSGLELRNVQQLALNLLSQLGNKNDPVYSAL